ncbi:hypothetical protein Pfo_015378 [Paulownia fortunei]|nr:hypothetical protein Pfo_015378 [Paulownia fortunei]
MNQEYSKSWIQKFHLTQFAYLNTSSRSVACGGLGIRWVSINYKQRIRLVSRKQLTVLAGGSSSSCRCQFTITHQHCRKTSPPYPFSPFLSLSLHTILHITERESAKKRSESLLISNLSRKFPQFYTSGYLRSVSRNLFLSDVKLRSRFSGLLCIGQLSLKLWNIIEDLELQAGMVSWLFMLQNGGKFGL